mmetsp:Transcript_20900/g.64311  ORF Transcript_20900/g.64311 Transcript_20900/m.64311 type:complete len:253 (-) Transcript_20900:40-798(-)
MKDLDSIRAGFNDDTAAASFVWTFLRKKRPDGTRWTRGNGSSPEGYLFVVPGLSVSEAKKYGTENIHYFDGYGPLWAFMCKYMKNNLYYVPPDVGAIREKIAKAAEAKAAAAAAAAAAVVPEQLQADEAPARPAVADPVPPPPTPALPATAPAVLPPSPLAEAGSPEASATKVSSLEQENARLRAKLKEAETSVRELLDSREVAWAGALATSQRETTHFATRVRNDFKSNATEPPSFIDHLALISATFQPDE